MKLEILHENQPDWEPFSSLDSAAFNHFMSLVKTLTKGMKFDHSGEKGSMTSYLFHNSLVELELMGSVSKSKDNYPYLMLMVQARLNENLMVTDTQKDMDSRVLMNFHLFVYDQNAQREADKIAEDCQKTKKNYR